MVAPTPDDLRAIMDLTSDALSDQRALTYIGLAVETLTNTTDRLAILYFTCWKIANSASWSHVTRIGDESFSAPNPELFKNEYRMRCQDLGITPLGFGKVKVRKVNSAKDDYPRNLNDEL